MIFESILVLSALYLGFVVGAAVTASIMAIGHGGP